MSPNLSGNQLYVLGSVCTHVRERAKRKRVEVTGDLISVQILDNRGLSAQRPKPL